MMDLSPPPCVSGRSLRPRTSLFIHGYVLCERVGNEPRQRVYYGLRWADSKPVVIKILPKKKLSRDDLCLDRPPSRGLSEFIPRDVFFLKMCDHPHIISLVDSFQDTMNYYCITEFHGTPWSLKKVLGPSRAGQGERQPPTGEAARTRSASNALAGETRVRARESSCSELAYYTLPPLLKPTECPMSTQYCDLFECIYAHGFLMTESLARHIFYQVVSTVHYLETLGLFHGDLKDQNFVIDESYHVKLIDFGSASYFLEAKGRFKGTLLYAAPEIVGGIGTVHDPHASQMWALGVLLYTMVTQQRPFSDAEGILSPKGCVFPHTLSPTCRHVLQRLLNKNPRKRLCLRELLRHPFMTGVGTCPIYRACMCI